MLILSGKKQLQKQVGDTQEVERAVASFIRQKRSYETKFVHYDKPNSFKVKPVAKAAASIKKFIMNIERKWGSIDFLLILGGDDVVPFFRLRNPCEDGDDAVFSDNPYASRDGDYLIPDRACGRIPDNKDALFITAQLEKTQAHTGRSFGISAKVWKEASRNVYRQIGDPKDLKLSPPTDHTTFKRSWLRNKDFLYFNLHGSRISANWYGQSGDEYPIALAPENISEAAGLVASEACYGAYILKKTHKEALSLRFLRENRIWGFCGSTTIAYGPAIPPSGEADLLVKYFFEYVKQGLTLGESLRNAKLDFARKALRRHGFLDDDDQKTILQFVLYADPTLRLSTKRRERKHG